MLERFATKYNLALKQDVDSYFYSEGRLDDSSDFFIVRPNTYMNMSGTAIKDVLANHKIDVTEILVIYDDINLEIGRIRPRKSGNDGGHNGIRSIISTIESDQFPRIRVGIGNKFEKGKMVEFVLQHFLSSELTILQPRVTFTIELIEKFIVGGTQVMLDFYSKITNLEAAAAAALAKEEQKINK